MRKFIMTGAACMVLLTTLLAGCGSKAEQTVPSETEQVQQTQAVEETTVATEAVQETVPPDCVVVSTPYGNLQYQDQWLEFMAVDQVRNGDDLVVTFSALVNDVKYPLFELTIGAGDGNAAGQITDANGVRRDVYVHMMEIVDTAALTDSEQNRIFAMQEDINYVIENLK